MKIKRTKLFTSFFHSRQATTVQHKIFSTLILLIFISFQTLAQDSLYLIGTIIGESTDKKITDVKGVGDINGDGYDDFIVSSIYGEKTAKLYLGSSDFDMIPDLILHYPGEDSLIGVFGGATGIGDVNNDGYDDFLISGTFGDWGYNKGKVFLYYGGEPIDTVPKAEFYEPWIQDGFGSIKNGVGDINKDGYDDFTISSVYNWSNGKGYVYLFWGGDTISWDRSITFKSDSLEDFYGESAANIGDINNDGFEDLAIGAPNELSFYDSGKVYVYYGAEQMNTIADTILTSNGKGIDFGEEIRNAGDLNKDGIIDFCITEYPSIIIYSNKLNNPFIIEGYSSDSNGDINNDGYDDLIIGTDRKIKIFFGSQSFDTSSDIIINTQDSVGFSENISILGDINGDDFYDILAFSVNWPNIDNPAGKLYFYSFRKTTDINEHKENPPNGFELYQNYPNPFNPSTTISYNLPKVSEVEVTIYDILGNKVKSFVIPSQNSGTQKIIWNGRNSNGEQVSSGIYLYHFKAVSLQKNNEVFEKSAKLILMK